MVEVWVYQSEKVDVLTAVRSLGGCVDCHSGTRGAPEDGPNYSAEEGGSDRQEVDIEERWQHRGR